MPVILLALIALAAVAIVIFWFMRANPSTLARVVRPILSVVGGIGIGGLLIFGVRFLPGLLPELFGLAGVVITALIARAVRSRSSGGFSSPGSGGQRTEVRTAFLQAWIDHGTGDVGGTVLSGRFSGRTLDGLSDAELLDLHLECSADADSLRILEPYLDRRLGADWRNARQPPQRGQHSDMAREEALAVVGLAQGASEDDLKAPPRPLIQRMHPHVGGRAPPAPRA